MVAQFWRNRRGESVRVSLTSFASLHLVDIRTFYTAKDGTSQPTPKGIAVSVLRLPELHAAIGKALKKARELGLIEGEAA